MLAAFLAAAMLSSAPLPVESPSTPSGAPIHFKRISSTFGYRRADRRFHPGVDLAAPVGTEVWATAAGRVRYARAARGYGLLLIIDCGDRLQLWFVHLSKILVHTGDLVSAGQFVARVGNTGLSTGPHLHVEIRIKGVPVDPLPYLFPDVLADLK